MKYLIRIKLLTLFILLGLILVQCQESLDPSETGSLDSSPSQSMPAFASEQDELNFLQGKFEVNKYLVSFTNPGDTRTHALLPEVYTQFKKMKAAYEEDRKKNSPQNKQSIFILSSFRNFAHQKSIWEAKFTGSRKMREPIQGKSPEQIISLILEYSSAPGTSRHHWGTDFDINSLENSYFNKGGKGEALYLWMATNAHKFGFCQPYTDIKERNGLGYQEEKWHWSYRPISSELRDRWISSFHSKKIGTTGYKGSDILGKRALDYVSSVSKDCQ